MKSSKPSWITLMFALLATLASAGGRESDGGNGAAIRILMARQYAFAILTKTESIPSGAKLEMVDVLLRQPVFHYDINQVTVSDSSGVPVVVSARIDAKTPGARIEFNVPYIEEQWMSLPEITALYLHEAGHVPGLSKCSVKSKADLQGDIGLELVMKELASSSNVFASHDTANSLRVLMSRSYVGRPDLPHGPAVRLIEASVYQAHSSAAVFTGKVRVLKLGPNQKRVRIHYSVDGLWEDAEAQLLRDTMDGYEEWGFKVYGGGLSLISQPLRFAVHYEVAFGVHDSWDNNFGNDYLLDVPRGLETVKGTMDDIDGDVHLMHAETAFDVPFDRVRFAEPARISGTLRVRKRAEPKQVFARFWYDSLDDDRWLVSEAVPAYFVRDLGNGYEEFAFNWDCSKIRINDGRAYLVPEVASGGKTSTDLGHSRSGWGYDLNWRHGIYTVEGR